MKKYIKPTANVVDFKSEEILLETSGGVGDGGKLGNSFNKDDVSYGRERSNEPTYGNLW